MDWFEIAYEELDRHLDTEIDGYDFLYNYLIKNPPEEITAEDGEEVFDDYVNEHINNFMTYIGSKGVFLGKSYRWSRVTQVDLEKIEDEPVNQDMLNNYEQIKTKDVDQFSSEDIGTLEKVTSLFIDKDDYANAYSSGLQLAKIIDNRSDKKKIEKAYTWKKLAEIFIFMKAEKIDDADKKIIVNYYLKAVKNFKLEGDNDYLVAATLQSASEYEITSKKKIELLRESRVLYSSLGLNDKASEVYIQECDERRSKSDGFDKVKRNVYKYLSNYGENPWLVLVWSVGVILLWSWMFFLSGINVPGNGNYDCISKVEETGYLCNEGAVTDEGYFTHLYFSAVTFSTLGYGDYSPVEGFSRFLASVEALIGLILMSLFIATFLRKFSR